MPTPETHAVLSASSAARWLACPPSAMLAAQAEKTTSEYAEAGRLAHAIGELKARKYFLEGIGPRKFAGAMKKLKEDPHYDPAMDSATDLYLDTLKEQAITFESTPFVALEVRVDYGDVAPGGYGTSDAVLIGGDTIVVCDYKNGSGVPVDAEWNEQMMLYAYGALRTFGPIFGDTIEKARLVIIQPHAGGVKTWETTRADLETWAHEVVAPAAALAAEGKGDFCAGDWCDSHFCPVRATCRARVAYLLEAGKHQGAEPAGNRQPSEVAAYEVAREINPDLPPLLSDEEVGQVLTRAKELSKWIKSLEEYVNKALLAGKPIPGWKLVLGRSSREWTGGPDAAFAKLQEAGIPEAVLYKREPLSPAAVEKAVGKEAYRETVEALVTINPGKPTPVEASDKRPEWTPAEAVFQPIPDDA